MRYILKLTAFALLGLLLVSCSKSSSSPKHNTSIKLQGVLEKGKATDGLCKIATLDGKAYSESNHIKNGGYVATVPAGAFDVTCKIKKYIDDKTGNPVIPTTSITLEAISFAKAGKNKTVNVNVLTDLVAKKLKNSKNKITSESSFNTVREEAERAALLDIKAEVKQDIGDIDTLHLDRTQGNLLTKVSLAIQEQIDKLNSKITTVDQALTEAKRLHSIATQDVSKLSPKAIATPPNNIQPPKPTGQTQAITLTGATIGGKVVTTNPTSIDITQVVAFSLPANDLVDVADSNSVYVTSDKAGQTTPKKLEGGKTAPYTASNVKDLFKTEGATTFTICVVTTITTLDSTANGKCQSADRKVSFTATARVIPASETGEHPTAGGTGTGRQVTKIISSFEDFKKFHTMIFVGASNVFGSTNEIYGSGKVTFSMPKTLVTKMPTESVYITSDKAGATALPLTLEEENYKNADISSLLLPAGQLTTLHLCILTTTDTPDAALCRKSTTQKNLPVMVVGANSGFKPVTSAIMIGATPLDPQGRTPTRLGAFTLIDNTEKITFSMPKTLVTKSPGEAVYITSSHSSMKERAIKLNLVDNNYEADIKNLIGLSHSTQLRLCIHAEDSSLTSEDCSDAKITITLPYIKYKT